MDFFQALNGFIDTLRTPALYLICAALSLLLYAGFGKRAELSRHALQNTATSFIVQLMNVGASLFFYKQINAFAQGAYQALHIPTLPADFWGGDAVWLGLILIILGSDFCDYLSHRLMHMKWIWPVHAAHHSDSHVNGFTSFRIHFFEAIFMQLTYLLLLTWLQLPQLIPALALLRRLINIYVHLDLDWSHGRFKYLLASPVFHRWHHADLAEVQGKNLANIFPFFDVIFGTYYEGGPCRAPLGALSYGLADKNPILIWIYPFQAWARLIFGALRRLWRGSGARRAHDWQRRDRS